MASGVRVKTLEEAMVIMKDLDNLLINYNEKSKGELI